MIVGSFVRRSLVDDWSAVAKSHGSLTVVATTIKATPIMLQKLQPSICYVTSRRFTMSSTYPSQEDCTQYTGTTDHIHPSLRESTSDNASNVSLELTMPADGEDVSKEDTKLAEVQRRRVVLFDEYVSAPGPMREHPPGIKEEAQRCVSFFILSTAQQKEWMDILEADAESTIPTSSKDGISGLTDTSRTILCALVHSSRPEAVPGPLFTFTSLQSIMEVHQDEKTIREYLVEKGKQPYLTWNMPECQ
jgi:hypothetical protein